ncbi:MAG: 50S ribosomal protein L17 [Oligoflexia bacterium]|nr:50S ribosomal protein L17 [Oligoflexia bacterium]
MYHGAGYRKLGKKTAHRLAMFSNAANSLFLHERIKTTLPKAKELRRVVERLITKGKEGGIHNRRRVFSFLRDDQMVTKLFDDIAPRFKDRKGGYTRVLKIADTRYGDAASMAVLELVGYELPALKSKDDKKKERVAAKAKAKEDKKAKAASKPAKAAKVKSGGGVNRKTGKAGASSSMKSSGSRGS